MRVKGIKENIEHSETKNFFEKRAAKYNEENPYQTTMLQDNNPELVIERNKKEVEVLKPKLRLNEGSKVLDLACGVGRWADAISEDISEYCGIDFSQNLIEIAKKRNIKSNFYFYVGDLTDLDAALSEKKDTKYNTVLIAGVLVYMNDDDLLDVITQAEKRCDEKAVICIREPIGIEERLTLKDFFSEELKENYSAIYRTRDELMKYFQTALIEKGFQVVDEGFLFDQNLNNRKETTQYYFIFER